MIQLWSRSALTLTYKTKHGDSLSKLKLEYFLRGHAVVFGVVSEIEQFFLFLAETDHKFKK